MGWGKKKGFGRTPNEARRVSTSVLFTRGMLVSAVRRSASGVLSTRSRISVGGRCSDCLYAVRYWPASSALHPRAYVGGYVVSVRRVRGCLRPGHDDSDVVEQTDFRQLSDGILVFRLREDEWDA